MHRAISAREIAAALTEHWSPRVIAELDENYVKVAKVHGTIGWHSHNSEDELFLVLQGCLRIEMEAGPVTLDEGDLFVVQFGGEKMRCGITISLSLKNRDWAFATFSSDKQLASRDLEEKFLDSVHFINYCSLQFEKISAKSELKTKLSDREIEVLEWAAVGKTSWEIAQILDLSERTINFHVTNAAVKLGVKGRRAACSSAITRGLIKI